MSNYSQMYLERLKERFSALAATDAWPAIKALCQSLEDQDNDIGITAVHDTCVRLSQLRELPYGPRLCWCGESLDGDFGPDGVQCHKCELLQETRLQDQEEADKRNAARRARLTPEGRALEDAIHRICLGGLIKRDVQ
jgi:hypothetical protein